MNTTFFANKDGYSQHNLNPIANSQKWCFNGQGDFIIQEVPNNSKIQIELSQLIIYHNMRGVGVGTTIMRDIIEWADLMGYELKVYAEAFNNPTLTTTKLIKWYKQFGFKNVTGKKQTLIRPLTKNK